MNNIKNFIKLDYISIKPYLTIKNLIILLFIVGIMSVSMQQIFIVFSASVLMGIIYVSYTFATAEINEMDPLYLTLPNSKKDIVLGRYTFVFIVMLFTILASLILALMFSYIIGLSFVIKDLLLVVFVNIYMFLMITSFQIPIYFRNGYSKSKAIALAPIYLLSFIIIILKKILDLLKIDVNKILLFVINNQFITITTSILLLIFIMFMSINLSIKFYEKREF